MPGPGISHRRRSKTIATSTSWASHPGGAFGARAAETVSWELPPGASGSGRACRLASGALRAAGRRPRARRPGWCRGCGRRGARAGWRRSGRRSGSSPAGWRCRCSRRASPSRSGSARVPAARAPARRSGWRRTLTSAPTVSAPSGCEVTSRPTASAPPSSPPPIRAAVIPLIPLIARSSPGRDDIRRVETRLPTRNGRPLARPPVSDPGAGRATGSGPPRCRCAGRSSRPGPCRERSRHRHRELVDDVVVGRPARAGTGKSTMPFA